MIKRFTFGTPIETDAVLQKPEGIKYVPGMQIPYFFVTEKGFRFVLDESDIVYGLGENVRGINKRGWHYESNCTDDPNHTEDKVSLYGAHNFFIVSGDRGSFGAFIDTPGKVSFDIGYTNHEVMEISLDEFACDLYVIEEDTRAGAAGTGNGTVCAESGTAGTENGTVCVESGAAGAERGPASITHEFRELIGQSYIPPRWAFGYGQCRWSYMSSDEVRTVAAEYKKARIPIDMIYLDIDYMERYKDFTTNPETFPDFDELVSEMKAQGIHLIPIIDGGVKVEEGYETYEEGMKNGYFCKDENGNEFVVGVWPGRCMFPDVLNGEAGAWFGNGYRFLTDKGIDGFWNDMNEPAIFYSEKNLANVFERIASLKGANLDVDKFFSFKDAALGTANNPKDYRSFYHNYKGQNIRHDKVHNLFGFNMTKSAAEALRRISPDKRMLLFSRASYIGMHRFGGIWMGDNHAWWSHLLMNLKMLPSLNMCGFLYTGADLGGFNADTTEDLMARWLSLGIFTPLMRNHSAMGTRRQELYAFDNKETLKGLVNLRYRLLPYIYSEFVKAAKGGTMYASALGFVWPEDELARRTEDQLMIGESIMIAPVYEQNAAGRSVYLPEEMKLVRFKGDKVTETCLYEPGFHYITVPLDEVVIFVRKGHLLLLADGTKEGKTADTGINEEQNGIDDGKIRNSTDVGTENMEIIGFEGAQYLLYEDDGETRDIDPKKNTRIIKCER